MLSSIKGIESRLNERSMDQLDKISRALLMEWDEIQELVAEIERVRRDFELEFR